MTDYLDAHARHLMDGWKLFQAQRWANADHLYGLAAECGLKAVMQVAVDAKGKPIDKRYQKHINTLWSEFVTFANGRPQAGYASQIPMNNPFVRWLVDQRYDPESSFSQKQADQHKRGAFAVAKIVQLARANGEI